jgi:site-specific DNA-cytosine methylase
MQDRAGKPGGGKGFLIQTDRATSLRTGNYQVVFQPVSLEPGIAAREGGHIYEGVSGTLRANAGDNQMAVAYDRDMVLDDQGGSQITVRTDGKSPTLRAEMHGNVPCVMESAAFCPEQSAKTRGIGFEEEIAPTLRAGVTPAVVYDARGNGDGKIASTLTGDHENRVTDYTAVVVSGETVALEGNGQRPSHRGDGYAVSDKSYTLNGTEVHAVAYEQPIAIDRAFYNQGQNALYEPQAYEDGTVPTLVAKGPGAVCFNAETRYIVRRLTPTECARLQGFADRWGDIEPKSDFSDEEYRFWLDVRNTHAEINGKAVKEYTKAQMLTWYKKLHNDSSEYKMWGNGIALPTALYVLQGIADE